MTTFPRLELADPDNLSTFKMDGEICVFDEAVLTINGNEDETIVIQCEGALDLADRLIRYVNAHEQITRTLTAAMCALRSYQFGNSAPDLAQGIADDLETVIKQTGEAA
ncbi:hypothetical protein IVB45_17640 [Bradyrhizobium sp. 4]|uniref:hypothetical protein n=1 Tax=unclassified Bradyrhizobium TaxID=2631580 RepID=UPI001FF8626D|nr:MULTISPECIES: hypothetical protein [unclassified Bradyrhizobium]MCK1402001.1 hypothetical protein [Bradyrhizobium sp. 39]MCK1751279.1 hypothetical protein [Bradyrhizobium sp. 135]UPJ38529.1 hypothetical protein IVB45_17640 [Bradyrhizobium sp. 4]